jgi:hypothetical protein
MTLPDTDTLPHPDTLRLFTDPNYRPPSPDDVRAVCNLLGYGQKHGAKRIAGVTGMKNRRTVRRWVAADTANTQAEIDYAAWRLLLLEAALVAPPKPRRRPAPLLRPTKVARSK